MHVEQSSLPSIAKHGSVYTKGKPLPTLSLGQFFLYFVELPLLSEFLRSGAGVGLGLKKYK